MRPRPRSRLKPLQVIAAAELAAQIESFLQARKAPAAILTGPREWARFQLDSEAGQWLQFWPGDGATFCGVPVIVKPGFGGPKLMATMRELEDAILGDAA